MNPTQKNLLTIGIIVLLAILSVYMIYTRPPRLGLDLKGGLNIILTAQSRPGAPVTDETMEQALLVVTNRVNKLGVSEPDISRQGTDNLMIQLPGIKNPEKAISIIGQTALLEFREVLPAADKKTSEELRLQDLGPALMTGKGLKDANVDYQTPEGGIKEEPVVSMTFNASGTKKFGEITTRLVNKRIAIVLDGKIMTAPVVREPITDGKAVISGGNMTVEEAKRISLVLQTGALPVDLRISESRTIGPTLGYDSLLAGLRAGVIGLILVALFMLGFYRLFGLVNWSSLIVFTILLFGSISLINLMMPMFGGAGMSLTLPGIAGIILMFGSAADSSIIVFERIKEEVRGGKVMRTSMSTGYMHGFHTFLDADLVTGITALIIFIFAIGPVKGFAFTLMLGIVCDLVTSYFYTRPLLVLLSRLDVFQNPSVIGAGVIRS
jgi:preprotein translocase subunit SecD